MFSKFVKNRENNVVTVLWENLAVYLYLRMCALIAICIRACFVEDIKKNTVSFAVLRERHQTRNIIFHCRGNVFR